LLTKAYENCVTEEGDRHHARFSYGVVEKTWTLSFHRSPTPFDKGSH
jgi:hypothetical protein